MDIYPKLIERRGVHHPMTALVPHSPEQEAWFERTCEQVECLITRLKRPPEDNVFISLGVHVIGDVLFACHEGDADWSLLEVDALRAFADAHMLRGDAIVAAIGVDLYEMLGDTGEVDAERAAQISLGLRQWLNGLEQPRLNRAQRRAEQHRRRRGWIN